MLLDLIAFLFWLFISYYMEWKVGDLVWSLWLASLVLGSLNILLNFAAGFINLCILSIHDNRKIADLAPSVAIFFGIGVFCFVLISFIFIAFHALYVIILLGIFPLEGIPRHFKESNVIDVIMSSLLVLINEYWPFIISAIIFERDKVFKFIINSIRSISHNPETAEASNSTPTLIGQVILSPHLSIMRLHFLILALGFVSQLFGTDHFIIYAGIYALCFFPYQRFKKSEFISALKIFS